MSHQIAKHPKHHHKPFRRHHVTLAGLAVFVFALSLVWLAIFYMYPPVQLPPTQSAQAEELDTSRIVTLTSEAGFALDIDTTQLRGVFETSANGETSEQAIPSSDAELELTALRLSPVGGAVNPSAQASELSIYHQSSPSLEQTLEDMTADLVIAETTSEAIAQTDYQKTIYTHPDRDIYSVLWQADNSELTIVVRGLIGDWDMPRLYADTLESLRFGETLGLQVFRSAATADWVGQSESTRQYVSDLVSPAVVKLYHIVCAEVDFALQDIPDAQCRANTGSGFFISSEGHIVTNGHVVVYEPEDALVDVLLSNPLQLSGFLNDVVGLSPDEIARLSHQPEQLAWVVSQIYDLPDGTVDFSAKDKVILTAIGTTPLLPETEDDVFELFNFRDTSDIKQAELLAFDYSGKDQLSISSGNPEGFSRSDVALLRIKTGTETPLIRLAPPADILPGQPITIVGFPSDAENELVDISELITTTTNGTISSVRTAAGGTGTLLQTDADASQGNSGGPAVLNNGRAVGLLTYRYKDETTQNAAKSYLRDITDVRDLLEDEGIVLNVNSATQQAWSNGLRYFANQRFSQALEEFAVVKSAYPAHRLVDNYISASERSIDDGLERTTPVAQIAGITGGLGLMLVSGQLIRRHHHHHVAYKEQEAVPADNPIPPEN